VWRSVSGLRQLNKGDVMTVTIKLPRDIEAGLLAQAQAQGLDVSDYIENLVRGQIMARAGGITPPADELSPEEWMREFKAWAHSHDADDLPVLSDEAISRESMYD
jgi:hypothetical protein